MKNGVGDLTDIDNLKIGAAEKREIIKALIGDEDVAKVIKALDDQGGSRLRRGISNTSKFLFYGIDVNQLGEAERLFTDATMPSAAGGFKLNIKKRWKDTKEVYKAFIRSHWNKTNEFTFTQMGASKVYIYDWKSIMENFTADDYIEMFKHGHDVPDDIGYELTKGSRNLYGAGVFDEKRKEIIDIRLIAYMIKEYKYSTEPDLKTKEKFEDWLHINRMFSEKNMNLFEPMKLYYEKLKKIMRKE
jgi:hypothetical protein